MDELFEISPSELPELEKARMAVIEADMDLQLANDMEDEAGTPVPSILRKKLRTAEERLRREELRLISQN